MNLWHVLTLVELAGLYSLGQHIHLGFFLILVIAYIPALLCNLELARNTAKQQPTAWQKVS